MSKKMWFGLLGLLVMLTLAPQCPNNQDDDKKGNASAASWIARGGDAMNGPGGAGGQIQIDVMADGGDLIISNSGLPAGGVSLPLPKPPRPFLGFTPWIVTEDYTVAVYLNQAAADADANATGRYLFLLANHDLRFKQAAGVYNIVSGIQINPNATLTLGLNLNDYGNTGQDTASLDLAGDLVNRGTITTQPLNTGVLGGGIVETVALLPATDRDRGRLEIEAGNIFNSGLIDQAGADAIVINQRGGFGGNLNLVADDGLFLGGHANLFGGDGTGTGDGGNAGDTKLGAMTGPLVITGPIDADGGWGANGGIGGDVQGSSEFNSCFNAASNFLNGGEGNNGNGGNAGSFLLMSQFGDVKNAGVQQLNGGDAYENGVGGPVQAGGGKVFGLVGVTVVNSGQIQADGGDAFVNGAGGGGGGMSLSNPPTVIARIINQARFTARGGDSEGVSAGGRGGFVGAESMGRVEFLGSIDLSSGDGEMTPPPPLGISIVGGSVAALGLGGGIHLDGGDGLNGGEGGDLMAECDGDVKVTAPFFSNGGVGLFAGGGNAGAMGILLSGDLTFRGAFTAQGGDGLAGLGGNGGILSFETPMGNVDFNGTANLQGGGGTDGAGGMGGIFHLEALDATLKLGGTINLQGGNGAGGGHYNGGHGGILDLIGHSITTTGTTRANGGHSVNHGIGGIGGIVHMESVNRTVNHMNLFVPGGDGDDAIGFGGNGGLIDINSLIKPTDFGGHFNAAGGHGGNTDGLDGDVIIDGVPFWP